MKLQKTALSIAILAGLGFAGQTFAQVGSSQCMHTTGAVCTPVGRWTYSR